MDHLDRLALGAEKVIKAYKGLKEIKAYKALEVQKPQL
jgi:hypothetical protein